MGENGRLPHSNTIFFGGCGCVPPRHNDFNEAKRPFPPNYAVDCTVLWEKRPFPLNYVGDYTALWGKTAVCP